MCLAAQDIEAFLSRFKSEQSMIHMMCPSVVEMIWYVVSLCGKDDLV